MRKFRTLFMVVILLTILSMTVFANPYPATLDNGNLVLVDGGMGVGKYADCSSAVVEKHEPPDYQIVVSVYPVTFSDDYYRQHGTYVGGSYKIDESFLLRFRYNWNHKTLRYEMDGDWQAWDVNHDYSHAEGQPMIPYAAEVAFVSAYNMKFFDTKTGYSTVLKSYRRVINDDLYKALGI